MGTSGHRDCGAAKYAETLVTSENRRLLLLRGKILRKVGAGTVSV